MASLPTVFMWDDEAQVMRPSHPKLASQRFEAGAAYALVEHEARSKRSHDHFFVTVDEAWENLPEHLAARYATSDHLRKEALIKAGYYTSRDFVARSNAEAIRLAAFVRPTDEYALFVVTNCIVTEYKAKSQSQKAMGKAAFQDSKDKVLAIVAEMIGTTVDALSQARAA